MSASSQRKEFAAVVTNASRHFNLAYREGKHRDVVSGSCIAAYSDVFHVVY
jgi:hypothetical protein